MDRKKGEKGGIQVKNGYKERLERKNTKETTDRKLGKKGRILRKVQIQRKVGKEEY